MVATTMDIDKNRSPCPRIVKRVQAYIFKERDLYMSLVYKQGEPTCADVGEAKIKLLLHFGLFYQCDQISIHEIHHQLYLDIQCKCPMIDLNKTV